MNILVTGRGKSGSWIIRGEQLGKAIGADVIPNALDVAAYDVVVMVKRPRMDIVERCRRAGVPLIWDVVDSWPQPEGNRWDEAICKAWLRSQVEQIKPAGIVAATKAMAKDCADLGMPVMCLPHHHRSGIERNPIREHVRLVGYEGGEQYLGRWRQVLEVECKRRGWRFVVNPASLAELDIVVAMREADGYAPRHYKSGVKLSNAQGSGTPFVGVREAGYLEMSCGAERFADTERELADAFDRLTPQAERQRVHGWMLAVAPSLGVIAKRYRDWLCEFACAKASSC